MNSFIFAGINVTVFYVILIILNIVFLYLALPHKLNMIVGIMMNPNYTHRPNAKTLLRCEPVKCLLKKRTEISYTNHYVSLCYFTNIMTFGLNRNK